MSSLMVMLCTSDLMSRHKSKSPKIYLAFHKPYGVLCQFTKEKPEDLTLKDFLPTLPDDVYSIGRLDKDSEGLLLLTNDNKFKTRLLDPASKLKKTYWIQVDGQIDEKSINKLKDGPVIRINKIDYKTLPCEARIIPSPDIPERIPPVRYRKSIPTSWVEISIVEGKNRQVRRMGAAVGYPVLRLVRCKIGKFKLNDLARGTWKNFKPEQFF